MNLQQQQTPQCHPPSNGLVWFKSPSHQSEPPTTGGFEHMQKVRQSITANIMWIQYVWCQISRIQSMSIELWVSSSAMPVSFPPLKCLFLRDTNMDYRSSAERHLPQRAQLPLRTSAPDSASSHKGGRPTPRTPGAPARGRLRELQQIKGGVACTLTTGRPGRHAIQHHKR